MKVNVYEGIIVIYVKVFFMYAIYTYEMSPLQVRVHCRACTRRYINKENIVAINL